IERGDVLERGEPHGFGQLRAQRQCDLCPHVAAVTHQDIRSNPNPFHTRSSTWLSTRWGHRTARTRTTERSRLVAEGKPGQKCCTTRTVVVAYNMWVTYMAVVWPVWLGVHPTAP